MILILLLCISLFAEDGQQNNNPRYNSLFYVSDCNFENIILNNNPESFVKKFKIINNDSCVFNPTFDEIKIIGYSISNNSIISHNLPEITKDNPLILLPYEFIEFDDTINPTKNGKINEKIIFYNEEGYYCDNECIISISPRKTIPEIEAQNYDFGDIPLNTENNLKIYSPENSELITVFNPDEGGFAHTLLVRGINFEGVKGPVGTNNGLSAFSFDEEFKSVLPFIPNNYFRNINLAPGSSSLQHKIFFNPIAIGDYEINYYFKNNAEPEGEETRYTIKAKVVNPESKVKLNTSNLKFYPNPAIDYITIEESGISNIEIFNLVGEKIYEKENLFIEKSINISNLQSGIYLIKYFKENEIYVEKLIVQ